MEPVWGVEAVLTAYAAGPANVAARAAAATARATFLGRWAIPARASAAAMPTTTTTHFSQGTKPSTRSRRYHANTEVSAVVKERTPAAT